jgi:hypothetical protein
MASYCANQPPAKVVIQFKNGAKEEVISSNVPVDVSVTKKKPVETEEDGDDTAQGNCCNVTYLVKINFTACTLSRFGTGECEGEPGKDSVEAHFTGKLVGIKLSKVGDIATGVIATVKDCEGKEHDERLLGLAGSKIISYSIGSIKRADGKPDLCDPPDPDQGKCVITIKGANGSIIYKKEDECPIKHKVRCGNQCADGEIRCESNSYPGYCCIDCEDLARAIRQ